MGLILDQGENRVAKLCENCFKVLYETPTKVSPLMELALRFRPIFRCGQEPYPDPAMPVL